MDTEESSSATGLTILFLLLLSITLGNAAPRSMYYRLSPKWIHQRNPTVLDLNEDGTDELIISRGDQTAIKNWDDRYYFHSFRIALNCPFSAYPIPGNNLDSLYFIITYHKADTVYVKMLPPTIDTQGKSIPENRLLTLDRFVKSPQTHPSDFNEIINYFGHFTNRQGKKIYLFRIDCGYDKRGVRGLMAVDIEENKILWKRLIGPQVANVRLADLDGDGMLEIVTSTYAPNNGVSWEGTSDDSSYILVYNTEGQRLWKKSFGPYWTAAYADVGDFDGTGKKKIVVLQNTNMDQPFYQDKMFIVDPANWQIIAEKGIGDNIAVQRERMPDLCKDFNGDGKDEIVIGNSDGFVRLLDGSLKELTHSRHYQEIIISAVEDLDGDGIYEIVCRIPDESIVVLNNNLEQLCEYQYPVSLVTRVQPVHVNRETFILFHYIVNGISQAALLQFQKSSIPFPVMDTAKSPFYYILAALFLVALFSLYKREKNRAIQSFIASIAQAGISDQLLLLNRAGNIKFIGSLWAQILGIHAAEVLNKNINTFLQQPELDQLSDAFKDVLTGKAFEKVISLPSTAVQYKLNSKFIRHLQLFSVMLFDLREEEHIRQMKHWAQVAQKLAHGIKNPLTAVKLNAEELEHYLKEKYSAKDKESQEYLRAITEQVDRLKRMSDGFMRFANLDLPSLETTDINALVTHLVMQWKPETKKIKIDLDLQKDLPPALLNTDQFEYAFRNVFFNAIESLADNQGSIHITTRFVQLFKDDPKDGAYSNYIELQIHDTGTGIPPELIDKVTQPYFTTKSGGTGLGLNIVQKIMDSHYGHLEIQSTEGMGTTVTLRFKAASDRQAG